MDADALAKNVNHVNNILGMEGFIMIKYGLNDVLVCVNPSADNHEGLFPNRFYQVKGATEIGADILYSVEDLTTGKLHHAIDRFKFIGRVLAPETKVSQGDWVICICTKGLVSGELLVGNMYEVVAANERCLTLKSEIGKEAYDYKRDRFIFSMTAELYKNRKAENVEVNSSNNYKEESIKMDKPSKIVSAKEVLQDPVYDVVNKPKHYNQYRVEVIDIIEDATKDMVGFQAHLLGNIIKYVLRYRFKNGVEDLKKARFYLDKLINDMEDK